MVAEKADVPGKDNWSCVQMGRRVAGMPELVSRGRLGPAEYADSSIAVTSSLGKAALLQNSSWLAADNQELVADW